MLTSVPGLFVVELLDGSWVGLDGKGADRSVEQELEIWALVPDEPEDLTTRSAGAWHDALDAGALLHTLRTRTLSDTSRRIFDSTTRHLTTWWASDHPRLTRAQVVERVQQVRAAANESPDAVDLTCDEPMAQDDGTWRVQIGRWMATCDVDGLFVLLRPTSPRE